MRLFSCIAFALFLAAPLAAYAAEPESPDTLIGQTDAVRAAVQERLSAKFTNASEARKSEQGALVEYYSIAENRLLWVDEHGLNDRAKSVMEEIGKADEYGLRPADYPLPKSHGPKPRRQMARRRRDQDQLRRARLRPRRARRPHRSPEKLSPNLDPNAHPARSARGARVDRLSLRPRFLLAELPARPAPVRSPAPSLDRSTRRESDKDIVQASPTARRLSSASTTSRWRCSASALNIPVEDGGKETVFDASRARGRAALPGRPWHAAGRVGRAQVRGGSSTSRTSQAANPGQVRLILLNMERWRWLPHDLGSFYVNVNIPEFVVRVMGDGKPVHTARVVVGKPDKQTPIISNEMQEIVFNPYWNVPNSIKTEEIRPFLTEEGGWFGGGGWNTAVLERHNLRINIGGREVDPARIDWNRVDIRSLNIYQPPGPDNVLGNLKFVFPNKHDVYMHDTTQKSLFAKTVRAESHGCMRVQNPDQLALTLLKEDQGWSAGRVAAAIQGGPDQHIALREKIPVYITYFTLRVNDDGSISTFGDIYGHDSRMAAALRL